MRLFTRRIGFAWCSAAMALAMTTAPGCQSASTKNYVGAYESGRYSEAHAGAVAASRGATSRKRDEAALIAGLSAHALGQTGEAEKWLQPLANSRDRQISARACATLGLIAADRKEHERAAVYLSKSANASTGDESARAGLHAGDAYAALGRADAARTQYSLAFSQARDSNLRNLIAERLQTTGFTIQTGAFADRTNAERNAREISSAAVGMGFGAPKIVATSDARGRPLYLVQVGRFSTKSEAESARTRLGATSVIAAAPSGD